MVPDNGDGVTVIEFLVGGASSCAKLNTSLQVTPFDLALAYMWGPDGG